MALEPLHARPGSNYLLRPDNTPVFLTGSHTWDNCFDMFSDQHWQAFDFDAYLAWLVAHGHNCTRLWRWEQAVWQPENAPKLAVGCFPTWTQPWLRPQIEGPRAHDGLWKFDLSQPDPTFFARVRERVQACNAAGIYAIVMLHEGCLIRDPNGENWLNHPFHPANNLQGYPTDRNGIYNPAGPLMGVWDAYLAQMLETLADCDNVLWEVANEARVESLAWQEWVISRLRLDSDRPVGTTTLDGGTDAQVIASSADFISLGSSVYQTPPPNPTGKVVLLDTDHLWGLGGDVPWVQAAAAGGYNVLLMDPYLGTVLPADDARWEPVRNAMGAAQRQLNGGAPPVPDVPVPPVNPGSVSIWPNGGTQNTWFAITAHCPLAFGEAAPETGWGVVATLDGRRTFQDAYLQSDGSYATNAFQLPVGTYRYQAEWTIGGQTRYANPAPGTLLEVTGGAATEGWQFTLERSGEQIRLLGPDGNEIWRS